jgi:hypothetical protein
MQNGTPDFAPPRGLSASFLTSIWLQIRESREQKNLPPLQLTSRPLNVGMILGDRLATPWYRTIFTNIGDVISPETLPPLELQSPPEDVGELIGDTTARPWWTSLLRNLADSVAPEKLPPLALTSQPVTPPKSSLLLFAPRWSELLTTPKIFHPDKPREAERFHGFVFEPKPAPVKVADVDPVLRRSIDELTAQKKKELHFAHIREGLWISCVAAQILFLVVYWIKG